MNVEFKKLPYNMFTYMGIPADLAYSIVINSVPVGIVYLSDVDANGMQIEWLELMDVFQRKHLLRPVMKALFDMYGTLYFEANDDNSEKFVAIGALKGYRDNDREMTEFMYSA